MADKYDGREPGPDGPFIDYVPVTPADGADLPGGTSQGIMVTVAGAVVMTTKGGVDRTVTLAANVRYPFRVQRVKATGTTATGIVALYLL